MVYEYAVDPNCLCDWQRLRFIADSIGVPKGRLVSEYPGSWRRTVLQILAGRLPAEKTRLEVQFQRIRSGLISSNRRIFDGEHGDWLTNAEAAHASDPFRAIVAAANPRTNPSVLVIDDIDETTALWRTSHNFPVPRKAKDMAATVRLLLHVAYDIVFVDPHFDPAAIRFRRPFEQFLACCAQSRNNRMPRIRIMTRTDYPATAGDAYEGNCRHYLAPLIPNTLTCELVRIREKTTPSEVIHNRFVLTDRGGVKFGIGLDDDDGDDGQTDDVDLLSQDTFDLRWRQYALMQAFDETVPVATIAGTKVW
jgi:hypothetical protein